MLLWLKDNMGTIVVGAVLLLLVFLVLRKMLRDRKAGKSACGCDCSKCGGGCHCQKNA